MNTVKKVIANILATTALTLITLGTIGTVMGASVLFFRTIFQALAANTLIHTGLLLVRRIESRYAFLEWLYEIGYVLLILIPFGFLFGWYSSTPLWIVICMGIGIYLAGCAVNIIKLNKDIEIINKELERLKR